MVVWCFYTGYMTVNLSVSVRFSQSARRIGTSVCLYWCGGSNRMFFVCL